MRDDADLENRAAVALRHYREAFAKVEALAQEDASAHRTLTGVLPDLERAILEDGVPSAKDSLFETGSAAVTRSNEAWSALSEATATLEVARRALIALEQQLGYIPGVSSANSKDIRHT